MWGRTDEHYEKACPLFSKFCKNSLVPFLTSVCILRCNAIANQRVPRVNFGTWKLQWPGQLFWILFSCVCFDFRRFPPLLHATLQVIKVLSNFVILQLFGFWFGFGYGMWVFIFIFLLSTFKTSETVFFMLFETLSFLIHSGCHAQSSGATNRVTEYNSCLCWALYFAVTVIWSDTEVLPHCVFFFAFSVTCSISLPHLKALMGVHFFQVVPLIICHSSRSAINIFSVQM